jgi:hypothetical protein
MGLFSTGMAVIANLERQDRVSMIKLFTAYFGVCLNLLACLCGSGTGGDGTA